MIDLERLKEIAKTSAEDISSSITFIGLCSESYVEDPICLIQLSLSILMDKPIFLLIEKGCKPSKNLIRILEGYEFYDEGDNMSVEEAMKSLIVKVSKYLAEKI